MSRLPAAILVPMLLLSREAGATVTTPYPGIVHRAEAAAGQRFHVVELDLARPSLSLHVSAEANRQKVVSSIAKAEGAVIAVNASFFRADYSLCGIAVARGVPWTRVDDTSCVHGMAWGRVAASWQLLPTTGLAKGPFPAGVTEVVSGYPTLVKSGVLCDGTSSACSIPTGASTSFRGLNPRSMLGVDATRSKAFLVAVDGRDAGSAAGLSLVDTMKFMKELGATDAVNLDGGGSTTLWIEGEGGVQNVPSDGSERVVSSALVVLRDPSKDIADAAPAPVDAAPAETQPIDVGVDAAAGDADIPASDAGPASVGAEPSGCGCRAARGGASLALSLLVVALVVRRLSARR